MRAGIDDDIMIWEPTRERPAPIPPAAHVRMQRNRAANARLPGGSGAAGAADREPRHRGTAGFPARVYVSRLFT